MNAGEASIQAAGVYPSFMGGGYSMGTYIGFETTVNGGDLTVYAGGAFASSEEEEEPELETMGIQMGGDYKQTGGTVSAYGTPKSGETHGSATDLSLIDDCDTLYCDDLTITDGELNVVAGAKGTTAETSPESVRGVSCYVLNIGKANSGLASDLTVNIIAYDATRSSTGMTCSSGEDEGDHNIYYGTVNITSGNVYDSSESPSTTGVSDYSGDNYLHIYGGETTIHAGGYAGTEDADARSYGLYLNDSGLIVEGGYLNATAATGTTTSATKSAYGIYKNS